MKRTDLIQLLATETAAPPAAAADELDRVVGEILRRLREGGAVELPGIGRLAPDPTRGVVLQQAKPARRKGRQ